MFDEKTVPPRKYMSAERAVLQVRFVEANGLKGGAWVGGSSDPFIEAYMEKTRIFRTQIKYKTVNPEWDEETFFIMREPSQILFLTVYDSDGGYANRDFLGRVQ